MRLTHLTEAKLPKLNGLSVMSLDQFVKNKDNKELKEFSRSEDRWEDGPGDDPYGKPTPEYYSRSIDFFGKFEADHFDKEDFNEKTGEFKGYWDYDGKLKQIAYFKFDDPLQASKDFDDSPGMGWYYEPVDEARKANTASARAELNKRKRKADPVQQDKKKQEEDDAWALLQRHMNKKQDVAEAGFGLGSKFRKVGDDEMQDYLGRVKDKEKLKTDKYKMPFVHGSNIEIKNEEGKKYDTDKLKAAIMQRPKQLLKQNEKMEHSDGSTSIFFNVGLPALKGLAVNEENGDFVIVDTCPGAGACQTYCYAMKGGYIQWKASSMAQTRVLNFLLNDPEGFKKMMSYELGQAERKYGKKGTKVVVRWHDAGDFFSSEYLDVAYSIAQDFPDIDFYAYTKMGGVANAARPANFKMNFSQGAKRGEEKKVEFHKTKHSRVVPRDMFYDLIAREGSTLIKDSKGRTQFRGPGELDEFKDRLAKAYKLDKNSIITYDKMMSTKDDGNQRWNVIVMPGDGDDSANRADVLGTYLLFH